MPKAYWIAHVTVFEPIAYSKYAIAATDAFEKYGGHILARAGKSVGLEGEFSERNVVVEFDDFDAAMGCYNSSEYQTAKKFRTNASDIQLMIAEGID